MTVIKRLIIRKNTTSSYLDWQASWCLGSVLNIAAPQCASQWLRVMTWQYHGRINTQGSAGKGSSFRCKTYSRVKMKTKLNSSQRCWCGGGASGGSSANQKTQRLSSWKSPGGLCPLPVSLNTVRLTGSDTAPCDWNLVQPCVSATLSDLKITGESQKVKLTSNTLV